MYHIPHTLNHSILCTHLRLSEDLSTRLLEIFGIRPCDPSKVHYPSIWGMNCHHSLKWGGGGGGGGQRERERGRGRGGG